MASPSSELLTSCTSCGVAFPSGARFCPSCGVAAQVAQPPVQLPVQAPAPESAPRMAVRAAEVPRPPARMTRSHASNVADPLIGQVIADRYRIMEILGRGGMGVVYRVEHVHIGKLMAMKLLSGELASDSQTLRRFQREAKVISKLTHPNTVQIFDFGESGKLAYLVMEYLPGRSLASLIASERALPFARAAQICAQIAGSVEEAHQAGVIHRDIKPENVMILDTREQQDFVKVLDFGIAKLRDGDDVFSTQKGHLVGTPYYMAPEQIRAESIDHRVDIYALGALLYQAVSGELPFTGSTPMEILGQHLNGDLVPVRKRAPELQIPEQAELIISKAMARDPAHRYQSMAALRDELLRYLRSLGLSSGAFEIEPEQVLGLGRAGKVATRGDIDDYEKDVVRASRFGKVAGGLALLGVLYGSYALWQMERPEPVSGWELEPNDEPAQATLLTAKLPVRAQLGKRISRSEGDRDIYRIELLPASARVADIVVSALPNIDLALDLVEKGVTQPLLSVNSGGLGVAERIPNVRLPADHYYLRVRQVMKQGAYPVENVSDVYTLSLALSPESAGSERELNEGYELATKLEPGLPLRGLIGWADDKDVYCAAPSAAPQTVLLSAVPQLDLVLVYLDRSNEAGQRIDSHGPGEGEQLELPRSQHERAACFTVSAREHDGSQRADPEHSYQIALQPGA